ncbi:Armadillo-type fold [Pseudocohnilembus persalinus]|uniref:Armadillo-type fold n=1 Tax=Pseudocohnilembus persalinus TaxID=266149 RepID=A0A0V0QX24_PSEPJ|nr:Armadillo-type fold [Pseudocohnilembus persalinus]|eukprot:KRX06807.1 Armadillo-type fold [Pseudocohnilembus persalinus]
METQFVQNKLIQKQYFFHKNFPLNLGENYGEERKYFWGKILEKIQDFDIFNEVLGTNLKILLTKYKNLYGLTFQEISYLVCSLLDYSFQRNDIRTESRTVMIRLINDLISLLDGEKLDGLVLEHMVFYNFLEHYYLSNQSKAIYSEQGLYTQLAEITYLIKRAKMFFSKQSVFDVYRIFKEKFQPQDGETAFQILALFMRTDIQDQEFKQFYQKVLDELMEYLFYRYSSKDNIILYVVKNIAKYHPDLNWKKHYKSLFHFILLQFNNLLQNDQEMKEVRILDTLMPDSISGIKNILKIVPDIMVHLMPSSEHEDYELYWSYIERIFELIDSILNPSSDNQQWVGDIFKFFKYFVRVFINRYELHTKVMNKKMREKLNQDENNLVEDEHDQEQLYENTKQETKIPKIDMFKFNQQVPEKYAEKQYKEQDLKEKLIDKNNFKKVKKNQENLDSQFLLNMAVRDQVLGKILSYYKKLIYMEDQGYALAKMTFLIADHCPEKILKNFLENFLNIIDTYREEMNQGTLKNILLFIIQPIFEHNAALSKELNGIQIYLIKWLKASFQFYQSVGVIENLDMVEIYGKMLLYIPLNSYQETLEKFYEENPKKSEFDFHDQYNVVVDGVTEIDYIEALRDLEEWNDAFFDLILKNIQNLEFKEVDQTTLLVDQQNIFWQYFLQQSSQNRKNQLIKLFGRLDDQIFQESITALSFILNIYSLCEPEKMLELVFDIIYKKIIKKRTDLKNLEAVQKSPCYFFVEQSEIKEEFLEYEFAISNKESLNYYLTIIENAFTYSNTAILPYLKKLEMLVLQGITHEESIIFEKGCDLINTVVVTLVSVYPSSLYYLSALQRQKYGKNSEIFALKNIKKMSLEEYEVEWHLPGKEEREAVFAWSEKFMFKALEFFEKKFFEEEDFQVLDYAGNQEELIDKLILHKVEKQEQKKKVYFQTMFVILAGFASLNNRVQFFQVEGKPKVQIFEDFADKYFLKEYDGLRERLTQFIYKAPTIFYQKDIMHDQQILEVYFYITREIYGESFLSDEVTRIGEQIQGIKGLNLKKNRNQFNARFLVALENFSLFQEKVDFFFLSYPYFPKESYQLFNLFFILSYAPSCNFKFFVRYFHTQNDKSDQIYHQIHRSSIEIFKKKMDPKYEKSYNYLYKKADNSNKSEMEKALWHMLHQIKRFSKCGLFNCCMKDPYTYESLYEILGFYSDLDDKLYKRTFINLFYKSIFLVYEDAFLVNNINIVKMPTPIKSEPVYFKENKCKNMKRSVTQEEAVQMRDVYQKLLGKIAEKIVDPKIHWKPRVIYSLFSCYFINMFQNLSEIPEICQILESFMQLSLSKEFIALSQTGRAGIYHLLNRNKRLRNKKSYGINQKFFEENNQNNINNLNMNNNNKMEEQEEQVDQSRSLEEFFKWHFVKKEDFKKVIKSKYLGYLNDYKPIQENVSYLLSEQNQQQEGKMEVENQFAQIFSKYLSNPDFCKKLIDNIMLDREVQQVEQEIDLNIEEQQTSMDITTTEGNFFQTLQISFQFTFDRDRKKQHALFVTQHTVQFYDIYLKFFKKIFQSLQREFFDASKDYIYELSQHYESQEKQRVSFFYVCALIKWLQKVDFLENQGKWQDIIDYCIEIGERVIKNTSTEIFKDFLSSINYACRDNDFRLVKLFMEPWLKLTANYKQLGKRFRYYHILKVFINNNGIRTREFALQAVDKIRNEEIKDKSEVEEIVDNFVDIMCSVIVIPLNIQKMKAEGWIEGGLKQHEDKIFLNNEITAFENNEKLQSFFKSIEEKVFHQTDKDVKRIYSYMFIKIMEYLAVPKYNMLFWSYFKNIFKYLITSKKLDDDGVIDTSSLLQRMGEADFDSQIQSEIEEILEECFKSEKWQTRRKVIQFSRDFYYYKFYDQNQINLPNFFKQAFFDQSYEVIWQTLLTLKDTLKISKKKELEELFEVYKKDANIKIPKKQTDEAVIKELKNKQILATYIIMALVYCYQEEILKYTDEALSIILKNQNLSKQLKKCSTDFFAQYWTNHKSNSDDKYYNTSDYVLSDEVVSKIQNLSLNLNYYA